MNKVSLLRTEKICFQSIILIHLKKFNPLQISSDDTYFTKLYYNQEILDISSAYDCKSMDGLCFNILKKDFESKQELEFPTWKIFYSTLYFQLSPPSIKDLKDNPNTLNYYEKKIESKFPNSFRKLKENESYFKSIKITILNEQTFFIGELKDYLTEKFKQRNYLVAKLFETSEESFLFSIFAFKNSPKFKPCLFRPDEGSSKIFIVAYDPEIGVYQMEFMDAQSDSEFQQFDKYSTKYILIPRSEIDGAGYTFLKRKCISEINLFVLKVQPQAITPKPKFYERFTRAFLT